MDGLDDIIENILKMEIEDEFDLTSAVATNDKSRNDDILQLFDYRRTRGMDGMPPQEKLVVYRHLCREVEVFMPQHRAVEDVDLQNLLASGSVHKIVEDNWQDEKSSDADAKANLMIEDGGHLLYSKGVQTHFFTFILDGKAEVYSGRQKFRSEACRFTILCPELLSQTQNDHGKGLEFSPFVPDFTARVIQNSRILRISRENFLKCLLGKLRNYSPPHKETRQKMREIIQRPSYLHRKSKSESMSLLPSSYDMLQDDLMDGDRLLSSRTNLQTGISYPREKVAGGGVEMMPVGERSSRDIFNKGEISWIDKSASVTPRISTGRSNTFLRAMSSTSVINFEPVTEDRRLISINNTQLQEGEGEAEELPTKHVSETAPLIANTN